MGVTGLLTTATNLGRLGLGIRRAQHAADVGSDRRARQRLASLMAEQRGLAAKLGQLLATEPNDELAQCGNALPPIALSEMTAHLDHAWCRPHRAVITHIAEAAAAASFGQVHYAQLTDGREVAIKIRYPDIDQALQRELTVIGLTPSIGPMRTWGFNLKAYKQWLNDTLSAELDYQAEAATQEAYRQAATSGPQTIITPTIHHAWCRPGILMQDWLPGIAVDEAGQTWAPADRRRIAEDLVSHVLLMAFGHGYLHADLHPGNVAALISDDQPALALYDYGCVLRLSDTERSALYYLLEALTDHLDVDPGCYLEALGFDGDKLAHLTGRLPAVMRALCAPFLSDRPFDLTTWNLDQEINALLGEHAWWFRSAGSPRFLLVMRAMRGLCGLIQRLQVNINWHQCWQQARHSIGSSIPRCTLPSGRQQGRTCAQLAQSLCVEVKRNGKSHVELAMPVSVLHELDQIMDVDLRRLIANQGTDIQAIAKSAIEDGYPIGELFSCTRHHDHVRVSLA